jgi:drug/metabolite transporter (DMT)-like permease
MSNQNKSYLYAIAAVLCWSTVASAFKITLRRMDYQQLLLISSFVSLLVLLIINAYNRNLKKIIYYTSPQQWRRSALLGLLNPFLYYMILFKAYSLIPAQEALTLNYAWVAMVVLFSIPVLKQKITLKSLTGIFISFFGLIIIATRGDFGTFKFENPFGTALALGSSLIWALFWVYNVKDKRDASIKLFLNFLFGFFYIFLLLMFSGEIVNTDFIGLLGATYIGVFEMGLTFFLWLKALSLTKTTDKISSLIFLSPVISLILINVIVGEQIAISTPIGLLLIIFGIIFQQQINKKWTKKTLEPMGIN